MRAVIQRISQASVEVNGRVTGSIGKGLLVYLGVGENDTTDQAEFIARKISELRIFEDSAGKMNLSVTDVSGSVLLVSNFTLYGDCQKGRRPSFDKAAKPKLAEKLYDKVASNIKTFGLDVQKGIFAEHMSVKSINDGPVNFIIEKAN